MTKTRQLHFKTNYESNMTHCKATDDPYGVYTDACLCMIYYIYTSYLHLYIYSTYFIF